MAKIGQEPSKQSGVPKSSAGQATPKTAQEYLKTLYEQYGDKTNEAINQVFGKDSDKVPLQTLSNAPKLNLTLSSKEIDALKGYGMGGVSGSSNSRVGKFGEVLTANDMLGRGDNFVFGTFVYELGNILDIRIFGGNGYGHGVPGWVDPVSRVRDPDTGAQLESHVFGSLQY